MQLPELYKIFLANPSIQTDTRKIKKGDLFFALKGPNFNGNLFARQAIDAGASYAIIDESESFLNEKTVIVDDVLTALQALAKYHRQQFLNRSEQVPFIAITGSNGKTTTKELIHEVLSTTYKTYTTEGNLNNHIGIPLTILKIKSDAEIAIIEMGANHQKEIESYCKYTLPTHGLITNCGKAHLEGFGGTEGVKKGKGELFDYLRANNGTAFIMNDYDYLQQMSKGIKLIKTYGTKDAEITGKVKTSTHLLNVSITKGAAIENIQTQLVGEYNLPNILAAIAIAKFFNVSDTLIKTALERYIPSNSRSQLIIKDSNKIILDAYNANPTSMKAAIENFAKMEGAKKVLLLGGMMELGVESTAEHQSIINVIDTYKWEAVVLVGGDYNKVKHPYINFDNAVAAKEWFNHQQFENSQILIKGSRSMQMENVIA
jgi:UDP-N-acetylmuramoyl-tripeptide--D-alanyl-D-alanine ligase